MPKDEFDPEDPMELIGVEIPGTDPDQIMDDIIQEYLFMGWSASQILFLFVSPYYGATHQIYKQKGKDYVQERVQRLFEEWHYGWLQGGGING